MQVFIWRVIYRGLKEGKINNLGKVSFEITYFISFKVVCLPTGAEAESQGSAPSPASQQGGRNHQGPRGNKPRRRPGSNSHPPISSLAPTTDEQGSPAVKKIG